MSKGINKSTYDENGRKKIGHMPVSYYPYYLESQTYDRLTRLHELWQRLIVKVANDD